MAAPSNTVWGSTVNDRYKLGISITQTSNTATQVTLHVEVWLALKWNISDSSNTFTFSYPYGDNFNTITQSNLSLSFGTTSGSGWSESSQQKIYEYNDVWNKYSTARTLTFSASLGPLASGEYTVSVSTSFVAAALATYTVAYSANGGSGAPSSQTKTAGSSITLSTTKPTRTGYTFKNWNTNSSGTGTSYSPGSTYSSDANVTLYAQWTPLTHTIIYDANGGTNAPASQVATYGTATYITSEEPTKAGCNFTGWNTQSSGNGVSYQAGDPWGTFYTDSSSTTLYAQWVSSGTFTITYDGMGATSNVPDSSSYAGGDTCTVEGIGIEKCITVSYVDPYGIHSNASEKLYLEFEGWNTESDGSGETYQVGDTFKVGNNVTLYAMWGPSHPSCPNWTSTNAKFRGWTVNKTWSDSSHLITNDWEVSDSTTLYSQWSSFLVTLDGGDGLVCLQNDVANAVDSLKVWIDYGVKLDLSLYTAFVSEGSSGGSVNKTFKGWSKVEGGSISYSTRDSITITNVLTLYAIFDVTSFTVNWSVGYGDNPIIKTETVPYGGSGTPPADPVRDGYTFSGWIGEYKNVKSDRLILALWASTPIWIWNGISWIGYEPEEV